LVHLRRDCVHVVGRVPLKVYRFKAQYRIVHEQRLCVPEHL